MKFCIVLLFAFVPCTLNARNRGQQVIDSLINELSRSKEDTNKVKLLDDISYSYYTVNPDEGLSFGYKTKALSERLGWKKGLAKAYADIGINYEAKSDHAKALEYDLKSLNLYEQLKLKSSMAGNLANISLVYMAQSDYPAALEYALKALKIYEELGDKRAKAITLENIGSLYLEQKNYQKTEEYYTDAEKVYRELDDKQGVARNLGNEGIVEDAKGNYDKALEYHLKALKTNEELGNKEAIQINLANVGYVYCHMKQYAKALEYQLAALKISEELGNKSSIAINMGNIGETHLAMVRDKTKPAYSDKTANLDDAIKYLDDATALCREINFSAPLIEFSQYLSEAYSLKGDYKKAYDTYKFYTVLKDSIFSLEKMAQLTNLETKREVELKNKDLQLKDKQIRIHQLEIAEKQHESILYIISIILLVLLIGIAMKSMLAYKKSNQMLSDEKRKHLTLIEEQIKHIKIRNEVLEDIAHMQAHDIRGPVATILGLAQAFNYDDPSDPENTIILEGISSVTEKLDAVVKEIIKKKNSLDA